MLKTSAGCCFRVHHGLHQEWYVEHKYRFFEEYVQSPPRTSGNGCYFRTVTHAEFSNYREHFYPLNKKVVPISLVCERLTPLGLAIWIMDDGSADRSAVRLNTQSFTECENVGLAGILRTTFGLEARLNRDKSGFRLRITAGSRARLLEIVGAHIHPRMAYKLSAIV